MKVQSGGSVLKYFIWDSFGGVLVLLSSPIVIKAGGRQQNDPWNLHVSYWPNPPRPCEKLTFTWNLTDAPSYTKAVLAINNDQESLSQFTVPFSTSTFEWLVSTASAVSLGLVVFVPDLTQTTNRHLATTLQVHSAPTTCAAPAVPSDRARTTPNTITTSSTLSFLPTPTSPMGTLSPVVPPPSLTATATSTPTSSAPHPTGPSFGSSTSVSQPNNTTPGGSSILGRPVPADVRSSAAVNFSAALTRGISPSPSASGTHGSSRASSSHTIAEAAVGSLAVIAFIVLLARYLLRRTRANRTLRRASILSTDVSPYQPYLDSLPYTPRSSDYQDASLCSDSYVSDAESEKPLAAWNPGLFVREQLTEADAVGPAPSPLGQDSSLPSCTPQ